MTRVRHAKSMDMLHGPILGKILLFALPLTFTSMLQQLFNSADSAIAGRFVSNEALAGIGATAPIVSLLVSLFVGLSVGANVLIAVRIGQQREDDIQEAVHTIVGLSIVSGIALLIIGLIFAEPLLAIIGTPSDVFDLAGIYLRIYFVGMPFFLLYNFVSAILRSKGDTLRPLYALACGCALNFALDYVFAAVCGWGVAGIAWATVISNALAAGLTVWFLLGEEETYRLHPKQIRIVKKPLLFVLKIGVPAGLQGAVFAISNLIIQAAINGFGSATMAGSAAAVNYEFYTYFLISAFSQAAVTFIGQNCAALQFDRCKKIFIETMALSVGFSMLLVVIFVGFDAFFLGIFTTDIAALGFAMTRLHGVEALEFLPNSYEITAGVLRGMGWSTTPAIITVIGTCLVRIIWVYTIFAASPTFDLLMLVYPVTWVITGIAMLIAYFAISRRVYSITPDSQAHAAPVSRV